MKTNFKRVAIHESSHEMVRFLAKVTDRSIASILEEMIEQIFNISMTYEKCNLEYSIDGNKVSIEITGRNNMITGEVKSPDAEAESKVAPLLRVKLKDSKGQFVEVKPK